MSDNTQKIVWSPQPRQKILLDCPYREVFFGGARGGGKSNGILGKYGIKATRYKYTNAIFFRKELPQADDLIEEAKEIYLPIGAHWRDQKKVFEFPSGSRVRFRPLESETDAEKYQGQNLTDCAVEEAGNYPDPKPIDKLFGALRSKHGIPTQLILTANPGGVGHIWLKERYIDPAPLGLKPIIRKLPNGKEHKYIYIPSRVSDNQVLLARNPDYINNLYLVGSEALVKAWLEGDWSVIEGAYFSEFSIPRHVIHPFKIPRRWKKYIGFDWGFNSPFCAIWGAVSDGKDDAGNEVIYPKGSIVIYREYTGRQLPNENIARQILELSSDEELHMSVADPSIFNSNGGETIADQFIRSGLVFRAADNERVAGWSQLRKRLRPELHSDTLPLIYFFNTCSYLIKTIPTAPIDKKKAEDLDTEFDDHGLDALRYLLMENLLVQTGYRAPEIHATKGNIQISKLLEAHKRNKSRTRI